MKAVGFQSIVCFEDVPVIDGATDAIRSLVIRKFARVLLRIFVMAETGDPGCQAVFSQNLLACARK